MTTSHVSDAVTRRACHKRVPSKAGFILSRPSLLLCLCLCSNKGDINTDSCYDMNPPVSTPLPLASLQSGDDASPAALIEWLQALTKETDEGLPFTSKEAKKAQELPWFEVLSGLTTFFVNSFPGPDELPWDALQEKLRLAELSLGLLQRATIRVGCPYAERSGLSQSIVMRLANFCTAMDLWIGVENIKEDSKYTAEEFFSIAQTASAQMLRSLGGDGKIRGTAWKSRKTFKNILEDCITVCKGKYAPKRYNIR